MDVWTRERLMRCAFWETAGALKGSDSVITDLRIEIGMAIGLFSRLAVGPRDGQTEGSWHRDISSRLRRLPRAASILQHTFDLSSELWSYDWTPQDVDDYIVDLKLQ